MSLLAAVTARLDAAGIPYALIGAAAMAVRGVSRATADIDLLTIDLRVLHGAMWESLESEGASVLLVIGDADDPLAGNVRISRPADRTVDVVVGRHPWQRRIVDESERLSIGEVELKVARPAALVLLKIYAGGPKDAWDALSLLESLGRQDRDAVEAEVDRMTSHLPPDCRRLWERIRAER